MDLSAIQGAVRACLAEEESGTNQGAACAGLYADHILQALQVKCYGPTGLRSSSTRFTVAHPAVTHLPEQSCVSPLFSWKRHTMTQDGLEGNRAVPAADVWAMIHAMEKAFPVLMSPAVDAVRAMTASSHLPEESLALLWVQKVCLAGLSPMEGSAIMS